VRAHEAGAIHGRAGSQGPSWLDRPADVNELVHPLWSRTARKDPDGMLVVGGVRMDELAARFGTATYVLDEADFRSRATEFRDAFAGVDVYYAGKAFLCSAVVQWVAAGADVQTEPLGGELAVALRAGMPPARIGFHGNNKTPAELQQALEAGVGRIVVDSVEEIERLDALARALDVRPQVLVRVTAGVEAHTHEYIATAHEDQKFGLSIAEGDAFDAVRRVLPELGLGGGFGIAYTTQDTPQSPEVLAKGLLGIVEHECRALGIDVPRLSIEPGRAIAGPSMCTLYTVGTVKQVPLDGGAVRTYVSVDGGMSDNIRTALYDAEYSCTLASRKSAAVPALSRVVGKHCEAGDIVVKDEFLPGDVRAGDLLAVPATGAYCRSMASNYNHVPRPGVVAVRDGTARAVVRRETVADLLRLDVLAEEGLG
jgi:diaminopimelate decarboxylase